MRYFDITVIEGIPKPKNSPLEWITAIVVVLVFWWVVFSIIFPEKAIAKTLQAKDCMTNSCVCGFLGEYVNGSEFSSYCSKITPNHI